MAHKRRIIANEAFYYSADRFSPGVGAMRLFPEQNRLKLALGWLRWWHWTGLGLALLLLLDTRVF